jgi:LysM repeat protein
MKNPFSFFKESSSSNLPIITLVILLATLAGLMLVGYEHFLGPQTDQLAKSEKLVEEDESYLGDIASTIVVDSTVEIAPDTAAKKSADTTSMDLAKQKREAEAEEVPTEELVSEPTGKTYSYQASRGETISSIANRFGLSTDQVKAMNPDGIKSGSKVKLKIKALHTVGPGDVLRVVAEKYKVSKKSIMDANNKKEDITLRGELLIIPIK